MQKLIEIINSLDKKPTTKYSILYGQYFKNDITYSIKNIYGGQNKYCTLIITYPTSILFKKYHYSSTDNIPIRAYLLRSFSSSIYMVNAEMAQSEANVNKGFYIGTPCSQLVLDNSIVEINEENIHISFKVKLPYNKLSYNEEGKARSDSAQSKRNGVISSHALKILLCKNLTYLAETYMSEFDEDDFMSAINLYHNQEYIRSYLKQNGYITFIKNNSILPRKGRTDIKSLKGTIPFHSPESMEISIILPDNTTITGLTIKKGISVIIGDAYHGKSTLLDAIYSGIYNHCADDGREYVITDSSALNIRAEDGRSIKSVDVSFFLSNLPLKTLNSHSFTTECASGSTSQAAAVREAMEAGCKLMLFDEDSSANNFMYKDATMSSIIKNNSTRPFTHIARSLFLNKGISSIIVAGASSEFLKIADTIILVDNFTVSEYKFSASNIENSKFIISSSKQRTAGYNKLANTNAERNISIYDHETIKYGSEKIKVTDVIPFCTYGQLAFIASFIYYLSNYTDTNRFSLIDSVKNLYKKIDNNITIIRIHTMNDFTDLEYVRIYDIISILNRMRCIDIK